MKLTLNLASRVHVDRRRLYAAYTLLLALLVAALILNTYHLQNLQGRKAELRADLAEHEIALRGESREEKIPQARWQRQEREIVFANEVLVRAGFRWTQLLGRLEEVGIDGVSLRAIQPDYREGSLKVTGLARENAILGRYLDRLMAAPYFSDVYLLDQGATKIKDAQGGEREALRFTLVLKGAF
jgi:hypothetical protein